MVERLRCLFRGCAQIVFLRSSVWGLVLAAIMLSRPGMALTGAVAVVTAYGFAWLVGSERQFHEDAYLVYNPLLVGLSLGYRFAFSLPLCLLAGLAGAFALVLTIVLARTVLAARLPVLSLPFAVTSSLLYAAVLRYPELAGEMPRGAIWLHGDLGMPLWLAGFFRACGLIFFSPDVLAGMAVAAMILISSRILFALAVLGYYMGVLAQSLLFQSWQQSLADANGFNFILIAMALGGVFLIPSCHSCLLALIGVAAAPLVVEACSALGGPHGIPPFTLPFCAVTIAVVYVLRLAQHPLQIAGYGTTPEEIRENSLVNDRRYRGQIRTLFLPFAGTWTVLQGFDGRWTHQGIWRYAYDFVITDERGMTYRGNGESLHDYYCYRMPALAPVRGHVVKVVDYLPDNPVGSVDGGNNWGNLVMLQDPRGFYVEVSHLLFKSLRVKVGDWVERGAILGLCGNSGYSPRPHIHVQAQTSDVLDAATTPFSFVSYQQDNRYHANDLPAEGARVEPLYLEQRLDRAMNFVLDDVLEFDVFRQGRSAGRLKLRVRMAVDGTHYFQSERAKLYFGKHEGTFYFYRLDGDDPYLRVLFLALPRLPLAYRSRLTWQDYVPIGAAATGVKRNLARLVTFLRPSAARIAVAQAFRGTNWIESSLESRLLGLKSVAQVQLNPQGGIASVQLDGIELRRAIPPAPAVRPAPGHHSFVIGV